MGLARAQADALVEEARNEAKKTIENAQKKAQKYNENLMEKTRGQAESQREDALSDAAKSTQKIKPVDKATVIKIFQKVVKEKFGV